MQFDVQEIESCGALGFVDTRSHGTIVPKGQNPERGEGNPELFVVKRVDGDRNLFR